MRFLLGMLTGEFMALGIFMSFGIYCAMWFVMLTAACFIMATHYPRAKYTRLFDSLIPERISSKQIIYYTVIFILAFSISFFLGR